MAYINRRLGGRQVVLVSITAVLSLGAAGTAQAGFFGDVVKVAKKAAGAVANPVKTALLPTQAVLQGVKLGAKGTKAFGRTKVGRTIGVFAGPVVTAHKRVYLDPYLTPYKQGNVTPLLEAAKNAAVPTASGVSVPEVRLPRKVWDPTRRYMDERLKAGGRKVLELGDKLANF